MNTIEASGRSVEEAVRAAAQQLGVSVDEIEYEVIDHGSKGFLGLGQTPAVVKAWIRTMPEETTDESERLSSLTKATLETELGQDLEEEIEEALTEGPVVDADTSRAFDEALMKTLRDVLSAMKLEARPILRSSSREETAIELVGSDVAILIGKHGQTLDALQYLVGIIANRVVPARKRVILDAQGYRERHKRLLEEKAREYADAVRREGKEAVLEPQPARDRRIIHLALANDPDVYTYSEGEGDERHVVISPKK